MIVRDAAHRLAARSRPCDGAWGSPLFDDGPGVSADVLPRVFEKFMKARSDGSRADGGQGTGFGLAIAKGIMDAHAREILSRALSASEAREEMRFAGSIIPWHHAIFVVRGLVADLRHGTSDPGAPAALLGLVAHPLEIVSLAALEQIGSLWHNNARLVWAALHLALTLCHLEPWESERPREELHSPKRIHDTVRAAVRYLQRGKGWPELPLPPPAWVRVEKPNTEADFSEEFDEDDITDPKETWAPSALHWHSQYASKVLGHVPFEQILASDAKNVLLMFVDGLLKWTNDKNSPPWVRKERRDRESSQLFEWTHELGEALGRVAGLLTTAEAKSRFLDLIFELEGEVCWALLAPFVSSYVCRHVYDAAIVPHGAVDVLQQCLERVLKAPSFDRESYCSGRFHGFDEPRLVESLMFVSVKSAALATRYVNGDWSEIGMILPIIDRFVRAGGWSPTVMGHFLTLCERAKGAYPAAAFADQVLAVIGDGATPLKGWYGTFLPARIAGLVQHFADRDTPMSSSLGQKLLRILDLLVDMGDRRSAALQLSETFREVKAA